LREVDVHACQGWDDLVDSSPQGSVFVRSWWLEAVGCSRILACYNGTELTAGMPLYFEKRYGLTILSMPRLTQTLGIVMRPLEGRAVTALSRESKILRAFAVELSRYRVIFQAFHPNLQNCLPFLWLGFRQTTRYTYVIDDLSDMGGVWSEVSKQARNKIAKARKSRFTIVPCDIEHVYRCERQSYSRHGAVLKHDYSYIRNIYSVAESHGQGACFSIIDEDQTLYSAWLLVWDRRRTYMLVGGLTHSTPRTGAHSLMVWELIQFAAKRSSAFDFAGSMIQSIERAIRAFGAKQVPYHYVMKLPAITQCCLQLAGKL
jgi:hypothetical protein